eukprot:5816337-Pleurochrysis_carterae.AAC.1
MLARCTSTSVSSTTPGREAFAPASTFGVTLTATSTTAESALERAGVSALAKTTTRGASISPNRVIHATVGVAGELEAAAFASRDVPVLTLSH